MIPEFFVGSRFDNLDRFRTTIRAQNWAFKSRRLKFDVIQRIGLYVITSIMMFHNCGFKYNWYDILAKADSIATERPTKTHTFPFLREKNASKLHGYLFEKKMQKLVLNFQMNAMIRSGQLACVISVQTIYVINTREWAADTQFGTKWVSRQIIFQKNSNFLHLKLGSIKIKCFYCSENQHFYSD